MALNKTDLTETRIIEQARGAVAALDWADAVVTVSAVVGDGLDGLVFELACLMRGTRASETAAARTLTAVGGPVVLRPGQDRLEAFTVAREGGAFRISGTALERLVAKADLGNEEAVAYLQEVIGRAGVDQALRRAGALPGDTVLVGETVLEFA